MGVKAFHCIYPNSLFYLEDVIRNKVVINIVAEPNKDRSLNIVTPTEELLVPPENRLEIQSSLQPLRQNIHFVQITPRQHHRTAEERSDVGAQDL